MRKKSKKAQAARAAQTTSRPAVSTRSENRIVRSKSPLQLILVAAVIVVCVLGIVVSMQRPAAPSTIDADKIPQSADLKVNE